MADTPTTFTEFGPDVSLGSLPPDFRACLPPNPATPECDQVVRSLAAGQGYCGNRDGSGNPTSANYGQMTYCACVNNAISCPEFTSAACANSAFAYKPYAWAVENAGGESQYSSCEDTPICVNILEVGGDQNVVSGLTQQCGTFQTVQLVIGTNPALAALAFILIVVIVVLLLARTDDTRGARRYPPPPPPGLLSYLSEPRTALR